MAEALRVRVEAMATRHPRAPQGVVTISLGVATAIPGTAGSAETLVAEADEALYPGQRAGRNRVVSEVGREAAGGAGSTVG